MLEEPIIKNKASFIVSGRASTLGLTSLFNLRKKPNSGAGEDRVYNFYDLNAKFNYQISKTDHVYFSIYNGYDRFKYAEWSTNNGKETKTAALSNWGNTTATLHYSKVFSQKLFARFALLYSKYTSEFTNNFENTGLRYSTYLVSSRTFHNPEPHLGMSWRLPNNWSLKAGYALMNQYVHQLTNNGFGFGYDAWLPSTISNQLIFLLSRYHFSLFCRTSAIHSNFRKRRLNKVWALGCYF